MPVTALERDPEKVVRATHPDTGAGSCRHPVSRVDTTGYTVQANPQVPVDAHEPELDDTARRHREARGGSSRQERSRRVAVVRVAARTKPQPPIGPLEPKRPQRTACAER